MKPCNFQPRKFGGWQVAGPVLKTDQTTLGVEPIFVTPDGLRAFDRRAFEALCEGLAD